MLKKGSRNSKEGAELKRVGDQVEALTTLTKLCLKQIRDLTAREAVLRWQIQNAVQVSQEKYDELYAQALADYDAHVRKSLSDANEIHRSAMHLRLLEMHDSKPQ